MKFGEMPPMYVPPRPSGIEPRVPRDEPESCSWCGGEGECWDGADPLNDCPDEPHPCHACNGSGLAEDQVVW